MFSESPRERRRRWTSGARGRQPAENSNLAALDEAGKSKVNTGLDEAISSALRDAQQQERAKLNGLPHSLA
jgi:hypothetical protein